MRKQAPCGISVPLEDHFPACSSGPSSMVPLLSAQPQRITERETERTAGGKEAMRLKVAKPLCAPVTVIIILMAVSASFLLTVG